MATITIIGRIFRQKGRWLQPLHSHPLSIRYCIRKSRRGKKKRDNHDLIHKRCDRIYGFGREEGEIHFLWQTFLPFHQERVRLKCPFYHTSWMAVVTPTDRPKSVCNRCVITLSKLYRFGYEISVFFNTKHPVIILRASLFVVATSHVASCMKRDESNRVYWFQTRFLSLVYL